MAVTIPLGAGALSAIIFVVFELFIFPVLMRTTSTLASFFLAKGAANGKPVTVRTISYPLWNEGLFHHHCSHVLLFVVRIICIVIPVYLETRFISRSSPAPVSVLVRNAYVFNPKYKDGIPSDTDTTDDSNFNVLSLEIFSRCASLDNDGWLHAKVANVTTANGRPQVRCVSGSEQKRYRAVERLPPFVDWPDEESRSSLLHRTPIYRPNITLQVVTDERNFRDFEQLSRIEDGAGNRQYLQVKNVTVLDRDGMECFSWRSPLPRLEPDNMSRVWSVKNSSFFCQNVTGNVVDYYYSSIQGLTNESNTRVLANDGNMVVKQFTVSTPFKFLGSLEFHERIWIDAGHLIRHRNSLLPTRMQLFDVMLRRLLYTQASNVSVPIVGNREIHSVKLDNVVVIVGASEVVLVLVVGLIVACFSRWRWKHMQRVNTLEGLSHLWWQHAAADDAWDEAANKHLGVSLRLCKRISGEKQQTLYQATNSAHTVDC